MKLAISKNSLATVCLLVALPVLAGCVTDDEPLAYDNSIRYGGSESHPIKLQGGRAVAKSCGRWEKDLFDTEQNLLNPNHGCAVQSNVAAMIARPADINRKPKLGTRNSSLDIEAVKSTQSSRRSGGLFDFFGD